MPSRLFGFLILLIITVLVGFLSDNTDSSVSSPVPAVNNFSYSFDVNDLIPPPVFSSSPTPAPSTSSPDLVNNLPESLLPSLVTIPPVATPPSLPPLLETTPSLEPVPLVNPLPSTPPPVDDQLVFERLWPSYYRASLSVVQDFLIDQGHLSAAERFSFSDSESIYTFLNRFASIYTDLADLSLSESQDLLSRINAARLLKEKQRQEIIGDLSWLNHFLDWVGLATPSARAAYVTGAFCYRDDAPGNPALGIASPAVSCNSGMWCDSHGCDFHTDCGPYAAACNVDFGCLNLVCRGFQNAIFDPGTSMCGCG